MCVELLRITQLRQRLPAEFPSTPTKYVTNIRNSPTRRTPSVVSFLEEFVDELQALVGRYARPAPLFRRQLRLFRVLLHAHGKKQEMAQLVVVEEVAVADVQIEISLLRQPEM